MVVVCGDLDQTMVNLVAQRIKENHWNVKAEKLDAQVTKLLFTRISDADGGHGSRIFPTAIITLPTFL